MRTVALAVVILVFAAACGSFPRPQARVALTEGALRGAQEAGAQSVPEASLHLKLAEEERDKAMSLMNDGENERADYMFMRSETDAALANAIARKAAAQADAQVSKEKLESAQKKASAQ